MKFIFASNNKHKVEELKHKLKRSNLSDNIELLTLKDINFDEDIPETQNTIEGNALQKAHYIYDQFQMPCISDDTGLEIEALNGEPGVYSARYAGENKNFDDNINLVLQKMNGQANRKAQFKTIIAMIINGKEYLFEGIIKGRILTERQGHQGFGYDPIFMPEQTAKSFAEMTLDEKNKISHRALATEKMIEFLKENI